MGLLDRLSKTVGGAITSASKNAGGVIGADVGKTADLVSDLWDKRDEILHAISWVKDHGDDLIHFMQHVPELLGKVGDAMDGAGKAAHTASGFLGLVGHPAEDGGDTVANLAHLAGSSLSRAQTHIGSVAKVLAEIGEHFDGIPLVGKAVSDKTNEGSHLIGSFSAEMSDIAQKLAHLAERVGVVSGHLGHVGNGLVDSSTMLKSLTT